MILVVMRSDICAVSPAGGYGWLGAAVIANEPLGAVTQPVRRAWPEGVSYHGRCSADYSALSEWFVIGFRYKG